MFRILIALLGVCVTRPAFAQAPDTPRSPGALDTVIITATRTERSTFNTPQPVTVLDARLFRERLPNGLADVFRDFASGSNLARMLEHLGDEDPILRSE